MIAIKQLDAHVSEGDKERATNSYLMSVMALLAGTPLPIVNVAATFFFLLAYRKASYFVRWHCHQALVSQLAVFMVNTITFWWTFSILFGNNELSNKYIAYLIVAFVFNVIEFIGTVYTMVEVRKGRHIAWWLYADITDLMVKN